MPNYFYKDEDKNILKERLLTIEAKGCAESFIRPQRPQDRQERNPRLTSAQLRRFYSEAKTLESKVKDIGFEKMKPVIKMLKSKVAYACPTTGRDRKVPKEFRDFIDKMVDNINDQKDFEAFVLCFESVVGYFYGEGGR